jgi:hypothetical protein
MPLPVLAIAGIAAAVGGAAGGAAGSIFGGTIDAQRQELENAIAEYKARSQSLIDKYNNFSSITDVININSFKGFSNSGLSSTYLTDLSRAFATPSQLNMLKPDEEL